ncbi:MAG TPA: VWA domain-containing protein [Pyrinomonadaceae bacterium]|jgi:VWFA-related protein|nr:VWA domain-containing protein [Pyrinomonadaceae bacterium]
MKNSLYSRPPQRLLALAVALSFLFAGAPVSSFDALAQSRRKPETLPQKKNQRPGEQKPEGEKTDEEVPKEVINTPQDAEVVKVITNLVNIETVVIHKKSKQIVGNLKQANFAVFEDGVQQQITNFATPEAKLNVAVVIEYSKLAQALSAYGSGGYEDGRRELIAPAALFMQDAVQRGDYISVIAYDMRPTPLTDFTNDPRRVNEVINLLVRNRPAFRETNLFDALKLTLVGGRADSVVLEDNQPEKSDYTGLASVEGRRRAVFLIATGIDTFSKTNYDQARKIAQNAGVPIYIIGTGNLFYKKYSDQMDATDTLNGFPGRLTLIQAQNTLSTFAKETGGAYFPVTFEGELRSTLASINALMRSQYSLGYNPGDRRDGKQHKIVVKVDINGDGVYDEKEFEVQHRKFYNAPKA